MCKGRDRNRVTWNTTAFKCYMYNGIAFRLKFPKSYSTAADGKSYPLYLFFHGMGEAGSVFDNESSLIHGGDVHSNALDSGIFDGFLLYPQSAGGWGSGQLETIASLIRKYLVSQVKVDPARIVVSGLSGGGEAAWQFAATYPDLVAACVPISAVSLGEEPELNALRNIPIWLFQGALDTWPDPVTTRIVVSYYQAGGAHLTYTEYATLGHGCWDSAWREPGYFPFLLKAHK
jgi:large repetitive protein